ncbi:unnamed protein product [Withania somnifera]
MAAPPTPTPTPPPPQSHQKEQSNNDILPPNITIHQPQQNLPSPLSGKTPKTAGSATAVAGATAGSAAAAVGATAEPSKKRGRPRKASGDGNTGVAGAASSEKPSKKVHGRIPGSGKKHQQPEASGAVGFGSTRHIPVRIGEDIVSRVMSFLQEGPPAVSVLSATGIVCNVTLRQSAMGSGTVVHEGQFPILSLSGSFRHSENNGSRGIIGSLCVLLSGPDNEVLSGFVVGKLTAASPIQMFASQPLIFEVPQATHPI